MKRKMITINTDNLASGYASTETERLQQNSPVLFFFLPGHLIRDVIPDYEVLQCKKIFHQTLLRHRSCHEALFGLGKLCLHEEKYEEALNYLKQASAHNP